MRRILHAVIAASGSCLLIACGGSGSGDGSPTTPSANEFSIEGTITNLKGFGAILKNNGGELAALLPGQSGIIFMKQRIGTTYNVAFTVQPVSPSQTCTVTGGSGTVTGPVTGLAITCVTNSFAVGGTVTGLTGSGLTMTVNAGAPIVVPSGATSFTFPAIESGTDYAIKIAAQPAGQTCAVNNGGGTVENAPVTTPLVTCVTGGTPLITISGTTVGLPNDGLTLSLNGGTPLTVAAGSTSYSFPPLALKAGDPYDVVIITQPTSPVRSSCAPVRARGKIVGTQDVTNADVQCNLAGPRFQSGAYETLVGGKRQLLVLTPDNNFSLVGRADNSFCPNNGNGLEVGHYRWNVDDTWFIVRAFIDNTGSCGVWDPTATPPTGLRGAITFAGTSFTITPSGAGGVTFAPLASTPGTVVGTWMRNDGYDGVAVIFEANGTYTYIDPQDTNTGGAAGVERGCYAIAGGTITFSAPTSCQPDGAPAFDTNGTSGYSTVYGVAQPFTIVSEVLTIGSGKHLKRLVP